MDGLQKSDGRSFWNLPEGKAAKYLMVIAGAVGGFYVLKYTAEVMVMLEKMVTTIFMSGLTIGLTALAALVLTSPFWNESVGVMCKFAFRSALRGLASIFTAVDPIGIRKTLLEEKKKEIEQHKKETGVVEGVARDLREAIAENDDAAKESADTARAAHKKGVVTAFKINAQQNDRLIQANMQNKKLLALVDASLEHLYKCDEILTVTIADLENQIVLEERTLKLTRATYKALGLTKRIMREGADWDLGMMAAQQIKDEVNAKFGQIAQYRKDSRAMIESFDLKNGVVEEAMLARLEQSGQQGEQLVADPALNKRLLPSSTQDVNDMALQGSRSHVSNDEIDDLFTGRK